MRSVRGFAIIFVFSVICRVHGRVTAPYQVAMYLIENYNPGFANGDNFPICSAVIVHPYFCVTTADCVHGHIQANNITYTQPLEKNSIYVVGGNFSKNQDNLRHVMNIFIHPEFNPNLRVNDIALIQLDAPYDLNSSIDRQWVALPDYYTRYDRCSYSISAPGQPQQSAYQPRYPFMEPLQTSVLNNSVCRRDPSYNYGDVENLNLCSTYKFDHPYMCSVSETQLRLSRDRGSPLICGNSLAGILSVILPSDQSKNLANAPDSCLNTLQTNAYYTRVSAYVNWIRNIISRYAPQQSPTGQPISIVPSSPPYEPGVIRPIKGTATNIRSESIIAIATTFITCLFAHSLSSP